MRRMTTALLLTCLAAPLAQAQSTTPQAGPEPQAVYMQQPSSQYDREDEKKEKYNTRKEQKKNQATQPAQSNCVPDRSPVGEGDPDAPQNRVEYGGGG